MTHAAVTGWGKCLPPAVLSNADLATFLDTSDEWILSRTGIRERRIAHTGLTGLAEVAAQRALAAAGLKADEVELIVFGTTSFDDQAPNQASAVQRRLGAMRAAAMDVNTACTSFLYAWSTANALIRTGVVRNALVLGGEVISRFMDWRNRNVAVLFGDGCAALVLQATDREEGLLGERLGCEHGRDRMGVRRPGDLPPRGGGYGAGFHGGSCFTWRGTEWSGPAGAAPGEPAHHRGGCGAGALLLLPAFGAGLTWCAHLVRWGDRVTPLGQSEAGLPPASQTGLELVQALMRRREGASA